MNYTTYFRLLIITPILMVLMAVIIDLSYPFPESINGYWGQLALSGFSDWFYIQLVCLLLAFFADLLMLFFIRKVENNSEIKKTLYFCIPKSTEYLDDFAQYL